MARAQPVVNREGLWSPDTHNTLFPRAASGRFTEGPMREAGNDSTVFSPVSYTHLTLPTKA